MDYRKRQEEVNVLRVLYVRIQVHFYTHPPTTIGGFETEERLKPESVDHQA